MSKPAARITDMHLCPMVTPGVPPIPHVGGPILPPGCPTVLIGGLPAARVGDMALCVGPPDVIVVGAFTVLIGGQPAARMGDQTAHGGAIVMGFPTVLIGESGAGEGGVGGGGAAAAARSFADAAINGLALVPKAIVGTAATASGAALMAWNAGITGLGSALASAATKSESVEGWLVARWRQREKEHVDGAFLDGDCRPKKKAGGGVPSVRGARPSCGGYDGMPKAVYTNGIQTKQRDACTTMKKIAESRCVEVVGIYNATEGMLGDLTECVENINRAGTAPAVLSQHDYLLQQLADPDGGEIVLYAHSQGGLITQESLVSVDNELVVKYQEAGLSAPEAKTTTAKQMSRVKVYSFGTAENGWPDGPSYHRYTNTSDPVPRVIAAAQSNKPDLYPPKGGPDGSLPPHRFTSAHLNPIASHDMNEVYLRELARIEPHDRSGCRCGT